MPYKDARLKLKIAKKDIRTRRSLDDRERQMIIDMYNKGIPVRQIARTFANRCSRSLIQFITHPERLAVSYAKRKANKVWLKWYKPKAHLKSVRKNRKYRQKLYKEGKLLAD